MTTRHTRPARRGQPARTTGAEPGRQGSIRRRIAIGTGVLLITLGVASPHAATPGEPARDLPVPRVRLALEGPLRTRLDAIIQNWLLPAPDANPGMLEMMRLRDRQPPYEDPVPWAGEFAGKYLTSCVLIGRLADNPALRQQTARVVRDLIRTQAEDGYLGPFPDKHLLDRWDLWGHYHCMLALYLWYQDTGDTEALRAATRAADLMCATFLDTGRRVHDAGSHEMNMAVMHILGLLHRETGRATYRRLMHEVEKDWQKPPAGDYHRLAATGVEFYQTPKPRWESLHPMLGLAELFRITGDDSYRQALVHWWRSIRRTDIHNSGSFSTDEQAVGNPFRPGAIETCCTVAWLALSVEALRLTADSRIADALEHATWNAVLGYQHPSGRWCTYDTPMNGKRRASAHSIVFQSRPGTPELNCCGVNGPNGLGLLSQWAVLGGTNGLYVNYYGPGTTEAQLENGASWRLVQTTDYPLRPGVRCVVHPPAATTLPLSWRIPEWSRDTRVTVNGAPVQEVKSGTYLKLLRTWHPGDIVALEFDFQPRALRGDPMSSSTPRSSAAPAPRVRSEAQHPGSGRRPRTGPGRPRTEAAADRQSAAAGPRSRPPRGLRGNRRQRRTRRALRFRLRRRLRDVLPLVAARAQRASRPHLPAVPRAERRAPGRGNPFCLEPGRTGNPLRTAGRDRRRIQGRRVWRDEPRDRRVRVDLSAANRASLSLAGGGPPRRPADRNRQRPVSVSPGPKPPAQRERRRAAGAPGRDSRSPGRPVAGERGPFTRHRARRRGQHRAGLQRQVLEAGL
ncbi:MAG: glycoside hydrolase family 127 protein [Verrucomicrobia bacterium]|nr:glycoside hydrolase family 127 protein [Verrucomicrobiota bacterium]